jgi:hypothetical protein
MEQTIKFGKFVVNLPELRVADQDGEIVVVDNDGGDE